MLDDKLQFSSIESEFFRIKVGRKESLSDDLAGFIHEVLAHEYDLVRIKVPADDEKIELKLSQLRVPFALGGIVQRYWIAESSFQIKPMGNSEIVFEPYSTKWRETLRACIRECFQDQSSSFFQIPYFEVLVPLETQVEAYCQFFIHKLEQCTTDFRAWIILLKGKMAGFLINTVQSQTTETVLAGVWPTFRRHGVFRDLARFSQNYGKQAGKQGGWTGARIQSELSQRLFLSEGMLPQSGYLNYFITPLFGLQKKYSDKDSIYSIANGDIFGALSKHLTHNFSMNEIKSVKFSPFKDLKFSKFSFRVFRDLNRKFAVAGFMDCEGDLGASAWVDFGQL